MAITIQSPTLFSPQANQNYFEALMQKQRIEAAQKQREVEMMHNSVSQGIQNITDPLNRAIQLKYQNNRADQRFDKQQQSLDERNMASLAARQGMTPEEYQQFISTGQIPQQAAARLSAQQAAQRQAEMQAYQQQQQIKQQQEMQAAELERTAEFAHSGKDPAFTAEFNRLTNQEMAILGDDQFDNQDPSWRQSKLSEINQKKMKLGQRIPREDTNPEKFQKLTFVAGEDEWSQKMVSSGALSAGKVYTWDVRNDNPKPVLLDGQMTEAEEFKRKNDEREQQRKDKQLELDEARARREEERLMRSEQAEARKIAKEERATRTAEQDQELSYRRAAESAWKLENATGMGPNGLVLFNGVPSEDDIQDKIEVLKNQIKEQGIRTKESLSASGAGEYFETIKPYIEKAEIERLGKNPNATATMMMFQEAQKLEQLAQTDPASKQKLLDLLDAMEAMEMARLQQ